MNRRRDRSGRPLHSITDSLGEISARLGMVSAKHLVEIFGGWEDLVGPSVAAHCRPLRIDQGVLTVAVDDPAWATTIKMFSGKLIENVNGGDPAQPVKEVVVVVRRTGGAPGQFESRRRPSGGR